MAKYLISDEQSLRIALLALHEDLLAAGLDEDSRFDCKLVFSELASNVVRHTATGGEIRTEFFEERIEIVSTTKEPFYLPKESSPSSVYEESGRGLYLIDSVCFSRENVADGVKVVLIRKQ